MSLLRIRNWDTWQTYRKDRSAPPWIKIYRRLLLDPQWNTMTDAQKGQLVSLWVLAGDRNGIIPDDPRMLRKLCQLDSDPDVEVFLSLGFIERMLTTKKRHRDNQESKLCQPSCDESDALEESREEESREEKRRVGQNRGTSRAKAPSPDFIESLKRNPAYKSIDVERELSKMDAWLQTPRGKRRQKTKGFILNWLNRIDTPLPKGKMDDLSSGKYDGIFE